MFDYGKLRDPEFFRENVLPAHSDHVCYPDLGRMQRGENPYRYSLNGVWKFSYARNLTECVPGFESPDVDCKGWADIRVPAHIQLEGYDIPAYVNTQYPWDGHEQIWAGEIPERFNPVASYVKYFHVPDAMAGKPLYISFQGAESALAVWLNGQYVGYGEDSFTPSDFDLTPYLKEGENKLAVQVFKWTSGSWTEDQDFYRFSGLFRDVYLYTHGDVHVQDLRVEARLDDTYANADLVVKTKGCGNGTVRLALCESRLETYQLADLLELGNRPTGGKVLAQAEFPIENGEGALTLPVRGFRLWSAEEPNLYELVLTVRAANGEVAEAICEAVGFRRFELRDHVMCINGKRVVFRGINRHEFSSKTGRVPQNDEILLDLVTMKRHNINAIRTSHYPNDSRMYRLCDRLGLYLIDENNMETHGTWDPLVRGVGGMDLVVPGDRPQWEQAMLDRVNSTYQRDKNHPSILIWSCGNESFGGLVIKRMAEKFRALDDTRLVHYEGVNSDRRYSETSDIESQMYTPVAAIRTFLQKNRDKPFLCCEYAHAMGNSLGAMHKYTDLAEEEPLFQGGFIWDYVDQSLYKKDRRGEWFQAYGGDFGERPTDYNFSGNGIVYGGDRAPSPKMREVKYNYQSIRVRVEKDHVRITNRNLFVGTDAYGCVATLAKDGKEIARVQMQTAVAPLSEEVCALPFEAREEAGEYALTVSFYLKEDTLWAKAGHEVAFGQGVYRVEGKKQALPKKPLRVVKGFWNLGVQGEDFAVLFSYLNGGLSSYRYAGVELLEAIPKPNFWRAPTDNDLGNHMPARYAQWKAASLYLTHRDPQTNAWAEPLVAQEDGAVTVTYTYHIPTAPSAACQVAYRVEGDGTVRATLTYDPVAELGDMPEFGMLFRLNADYDQLTWYGLGPDETYVDRMRGAKLGIYHNEVKDNMARYLVPQECGNKVGVRWAKVCDRKGRGMLFAGDAMHFSALPYTPHELENAMHPYELPPANYTVVRASLQQMGIAGDDSWGARTHPEYLLDASRRMCFSFTFRGI